MNKEEFASKIVNRIYDTDLRYACVSNICYEAKEYGMRGVQVFPTMISQCRKILKETDIKVCAVVTYPHGVFPSELKVFEAKDCIAEGADEVAVVMNGVEMNSGDYGAIEEEMRAVKEAAGGKIVKFFIETEFMKEPEIRKACELAVETGVDYVITSTGLYNTLDEQKRDVPIQTTAEEVRLIKSIVGDKVKIQAQGNIATYEKAKELLDAGADVICTRFAARICDEMNG